MAVRKLKPTTPGQRHKVIGAFETITASAPEKSLVFGKTKTGGRNNVGKMTMRYIGGGHKQKYRVIDFKRMLVSLCCSTLTERSAISLHRMDCK